MRTNPWLWLALVVATGVVARVWNLDARSLWFDEALSWRTVTHAGGLREALAGDLHLPAYFVLLEGWIAAFGDSVIAMRLLSVLWGAAAIAAAYWHAVVASGGGSRGRDAGLVAAAFVATGWVHVHYASEVRMYSMLTVVALLSNVSLLRVLEGGRVRWYVLAALALLWTHPLGLLLVAAQVAFWAVDVAWSPSRRDGARTMLRGLAPIALGALPVLAMLARGVLHVLIGGAARPPLSFGQLVDEMAATVTGDLSGGASIADGALLVLGAAVLGRLAIRGTRGQRLAAWTAVAPVVLLLLSSRLTGANHVATRYFIVTHACVAVCVASLVATLEPLRYRRAIAGALVFASAASSALAFLSLDFASRPGMRVASAWIDARRAPGDAVLTGAAVHHLPLLYYLDAPAPRVVLRQDLPYYLGDGVIPPEERMAEADLAVVRTARAFVVGSTSSWGNPGVRVPKSWHVEATHVIPEAFEFQGNLTVTQYRIDAAE